MVFLGNTSDNDDLFYFDLLREYLVPLTRTEVSEKEFTILSHHPLRVSTRTLYRESVIELDPDSRQLSRTSRSLPHRREPLGKEDRKVPREETEAYDYYRTFIAFGDSITAGKMKTETLPNGYYPQLAYPYKTEVILEQQYLNISHLALGVPGEDTYEATYRIGQALEENGGKYFFYLEGTNDVWIHTFSVDSSLENIEYTIDAALADQRSVVMATVPPRKLPIIAMSNIRELNRGIRRMAARKQLPCIEIFDTFMDHPSGWEDLMEDTDKKNHPNPEGHEVIAGLLAEGIREVLPEIPQISSVTRLPYYRFEVRWDSCPDFDHDHYLIEYGYQPGSFIHQVPAFESRHIFTLIPYDNLVPEIFYRVRAVDDGGRWSPASPEGHLEL
jgi:lysophospholipase L1-like esterase